MSINLFHEGPLTLGDEVVDEQTISIAEARLGVTLPPSYLELVRVRNGGYLQLPIYRFQNAEGNPYTVALVQILGIGDPDGIDSIGYMHPNGLTRSESARRGRGYPEACVVFSPQGDAGFAFDYTDVSPNGEPSILYADLTRGSERAVFYRRIALNFGTLIRGLTER